MPRLVVPATQAKGHFAAMSLADIPADGYKERLVKYIPAEAVALYAGVDKVLISYYGIDPTGTVTGKPADALLTVLPWVFLFLGLIGTPIYLYKQALSDQAWELHAGISTIAFLLWAYTLGGSVFLLNGWYHVLLAAIAAPVFTFVAGWFEPKAV